ncbi:MAG: MarR family winged helix-turn-helix transcriptional regulator [Thermoleophilaceae bacterium]
MSTTKPAGVASGALLEPEALAAWRGFLRAHSTLTKELDAELMAAHGLSLSSYEVLLYLADSAQGRLRMSDLAGSVLLSRSGLTRLVDRLERDGLVRRESCPSDLRGFNALITDEGRELFATARRTHLAGVHERFLGRFSREELRTLVALWERLQPGAAHGDC